MEDNAKKCRAADGLTPTFDFFKGRPLMVRAVDFNSLHAECQQLRKDADRYRWLKSRKGLDLRTAHYIEWRKADGTVFRPSHYLAEGGTHHAPADSLDAMIDAAMAVGAA